MNKFCMLLLMVITNSVECQERLPTAVNFDLKAGHYDELQALTWKTKEAICIATTLISTKEGTEWLTAAGVSFLGEKEGDYAAIQLVDERNESIKPSLLYIVFKNGEKNAYPIKKNIEYGQRVIYELRFSGTDSFDILIDGKSARLKSPFEFSKMLLVSASAKSLVEFHTGSCVQKIQSTP